MPRCRAPDCRRPIQAETAAQFQGYGPDCAAKRGITPPSRPTVRASTPGDGQTALDFDQEDTMHHKHTIRTDSEGRWRIESPGYASGGWTSDYPTALSVAAAREENLAGLRSYERGELWDI